MSAADNYASTPQVVPSDLGAGSARLMELAAIVYSIIDDLNALKTALETHVHTENTAATYTQNATTSATTTTVSINTEKQSY